MPGSICGLVLGSLLSLCRTSHGELSLFPAQGYEPSQYTDLVGHIEHGVRQQRGEGAGDLVSLCVAHSTVGRDASIRSQGCDALVLLGLSALPGTLVLLQ